MLSLDLSRNNLSELIPPSLSELNFLEDLNLSFNNLSGRIPTGSQLQTFTNASYIGNYDLCGPPTSNKCPDNITPRSLATISQDNEEEDNGEWCFLNQNSSPAQPFPLSFGGVSEVESIVLCSLAIEPEVRAALFQMKALSLLRPDGFLAKFYQTFWELIKEDLLNAINHFFQKGKLLRQLISPDQSAFIKGCSIHHNILLAHELIKYINHGPSRACIKVDLKKAFDSISWANLEQVLKK
ncbi:hypothetical protein QJS04_geneDACA021324 [Acorus gramineus]|uniref:Reverse transcriptase domain-containing protein n=1 Tax=Acorus gramineus TaxID=55184 RepID=A0AAV9AKZ8_ACOGR|nr:hypothetical protein QJS04_geneDACA021324 [Acorus gramineus]